MSGAGASGGGTRGVAGGGRTAWRMLAFDLDGTLLEQDGTLAPESAEFLGELAERGLACVAATGRRLWSARPKLLRAGLRGPCVVHNGALIADAESTRTLRRLEVPPAAAQSIVEQVRAAGYAPIVFHDAPEGPREIVLELDAPDPTGFLGWYDRYAGRHLGRVPPPLVPGPEPVMRVVAHGTADEMEALVAAVEARHGAQVRGFVQRETAVPGFRAELLAREADKWSGVEWVARQLRIEPAEIVAVGDERNDVELLRHAGRSFAAPGASSHALAAAHSVIEGDGPRAVVAALRALIA